MRFAIAINAFKSQSAGVESGEQVLPAGAVIMAVGINGLKRIVQGSSVLSQRPEFQRLSNLRSVDILAGLPSHASSCIL